MMSIYSFLCSSPGKDSRFLPRKVIPILRPLLDKDGILSTPSLRLMLSILYTYRGIRLPPVTNVDSITKGPRTEVAFDDFIYIKDFWRELGYVPKRELPRRLRWKDFHFTTRSGPNGHAIWYSISDLCSLPEGLLSSVRELGGKLLSSKMDNVLVFSSHLLDYFKTTGSYYRKVVTISDYGGKSREIAILDYWSQTALRPLHNYLFGVLRKIPQDCTFHQGSFYEKLKDHKGYYNSCDLSAATDRFPMELICRVIKGHLPTNYVDSWRDVMTGYPFSTSNLGEIRYSVGQPMGAYSSWNSFAVAHHYVVYFCCRKLGLNWKKAPYVLLGDDIVIADVSLANKYMEVMSSLGIEISIPKSHISCHSYEFAKRFVWDGIEISPLSFVSLYENRKNVALLLSSYLHEVSRGWCFNVTPPEALSTLSRMTRRIPERLVRKLAQSFDLCLHVMKAFRPGPFGSAIEISQFLAKRYPQLIEICLLRSIPFHQVALNLMKSTVLCAFGRSASLRNDKIDLGLIAVDLVCVCTGDNAPDDPSDLISSIPLLRVHGEVEERYMRAMKEQWAFDMMGGNNWDLSMRSLAIPLSDQIYYINKNNIEPYASFTLGKILKAQLDIIMEFPILLKQYQNRVLKFLDPDELRPRK
jgi:hypothetical protein